ncbi:MAG: hypothetical protein WCS35_03655 [Sphaerochaeta sp.]
MLRCVLETHAPDHAEPLWQLFISDETRPALDEMLSVIREVCLLFK